MSKTFRDSYPAIPWRRIIDQRNIIAHNYYEIDHERLYRVAVVHAQELIDQLQGALPLFPPPTES